jgi:hypothetical protein
VSFFFVFTIYMIKPSRRLTVDYIKAVGKLESTHLVKGLVKWSWVGASVLTFSGAVLVLLYGLWVGLFRVQRFGPSILKGTVSLYIAISLVLGIMGVYAAWKTFTSWGRGVALYRNGIASYNWRGIYVCRWNEVVRLTMTVSRWLPMSVLTGARHVCKIETHNGRQIMLDDSLSNIEELTEKIRLRVFPSLQRQALQLYRGNQWVTFGPLALYERAGVRLGDVVYPWGQIDNVSVRNGYLQIALKPPGRPIRLGVERIPNLDVFLSLIGKTIIVRQ